MKRGDEVVGGSGGKGVGGDNKEHVVAVGTEDEGIGTGK